jgi:hypothetical protein
MTEVSDLDVTAMADVAYVGQAGRGRCAKRNAAGFFVDKKSLPDGCAGPATTPKSLAFAAWARYKPPGKAGPKRGPLFIVRPGWTTSWPWPPRGISP